MRYLEKQVHMETLHMPSVQVWLGNELESRGIDSIIYSRHIIQLLQQDDDEEIDCPDYFDFNKYKPQVNKKGKVKKPEKVNQANSEKTEDRKKNAAIECLQAAVSEEDTGIEVLVEELCTKLKEVCKPANPEDSEVLQLSDSSTTTDETDTSNSSPDPAERYYAAFPALHGQEKPECSDFSSPYNQDSVDVWRKNPITKSTGESLSVNFDSGNESEKESKQRARRDKGTKTRSESRQNKSSKKRKSARHQGRIGGKNSDSIGKFCRFANWSQDWNYDSDSAIDYHQELTMDKERELCSQVENLLREILLPGSKHGDFLGKTGRPYYKTAPASLSEERFSPEVQEKDFWYTQPFDELFEAEDESTPFHQRLYKRHSYPSFECFNQTNDQDILSTTSSPSKKCERDIDANVEQHIDSGKESRKAVEGTPDLDTLVMKDNDEGQESLGLQLLSLEDINNRNSVFKDSDAFGLQELSLEENTSLDNDDSFGLQSLMVEQECFENLLEEKNPPEKDIFVMPEGELVPDALAHPNHLSYFLSSSPWTATEKDFREVVVPHKDEAEKKKLENESNYASPVQNSLTYYQTTRNQDEVGYVVPDEFENDKSKINCDHYREDNLPFKGSSSSLFDPVLKSNTDSSTSSNSSASVTTMMEHRPNIDWMSHHSDEKTSVPDYDSFTHPFSSLYTSFQSTDFLSPASNVVDHEISIPVSSNEPSQMSVWPNKFLFGRDTDVDDSSAIGWDMSSSPQLSFGGKASQLWDVNYQGKKMLGFAYPWKPFQHLDHIQETSTESNIMQSVNFMGNNQSDDDTSLNTLIPQITFSLISEEEESAFMNDDSDGENEDQHLFSHDYRKDFDRSFSLNELSSLRSKAESVTSNSQLSKSFELVPSEHSAFQDVVPRRIQHAVSEPNLQQYHLDSNRNEPKFFDECLSLTPKKKMESSSPKEHLFFSPKTHFQPIQTPVEKNGDTASDASSSDFHLRDLFGGCPKTSKTPYQKFQDVGSDSSEESFIPMFKLRKEHDKYIQTNTSVTYQTAESNCDGEEYGNICNKCGNFIQNRNWEQDGGPECICTEFYQNALEDFDIYGYVESLTVSEQNTPQNVPKEVKNACTDSGYEDFDTGDTGFEGSRNVRYAFPERCVPPVASIPAGNVFECITVEKSSGEKQVFSREDGWVMYKVEGGLGLQCLNEAHIRKNLKYAKGGKEEEDVEGDEVEDGEEFLMHQVEEEWLLNGYYCEGELLDDTDNLDYPVSQSVWSTGQDYTTREEQIFMDQQYSEREASVEPYMRNLSQSSYSVNPFASDNGILTRHFLKEDVQQSDRECIQNDSSNIGESVGNVSNFTCSDRHHSDNTELTYGVAIEEWQDASKPEPFQQDEDVIKVKLVFHQRKNAHADLGNHNIKSQETVDPQFFMPMPSQAVFSTDLEEEWLKGKHDENDLNLQSLVKGSGGKKKPCSFFMEGVCRRMDCKFVHDVSNITCRFWAEGDCFKAEMCPFLHGYYPKVKGGASGSKSKGTKFELRVDDFPDLRKVAKDGDSKSKTLHTKKNPYFDAKSNNKNNKRGQMKTGDKGTATLQKSQGEGKTSLQTNMKCSAFPRKTTSSNAPKNKQ
ncbi:uncharacterized protein LOC110447327 [Mizuhopecten yessoensis]|uniref:C3H1-type domain-containing protein n=1 Tax=Mizuhopecten yessoensis TaxID=6573 RepID=A0A210QVU0_MIZYE|nr:uncharacterized protein LOC110447327 [Mizuhopecten yessoensis]XP_021348614.1 uncharacterized protein LOC110447327 [Mizuhopecten yessoensis]OWF52772.1 hypothetical protein KP79_PYT17558 [Mizuhopecten yessoensis]